MNKKNNGFTLVELVIVITIICVLAAMAVSSYYTYTIKAKVSEGIALLNYYSRQYKEYYTLNNRLPASMPETVIASPNDGTVTQIIAGSYSSQGTGMFLYAIYDNKLGFGVNNRVMMALIPDPVTKILYSFCGQYQSFLYVPITYLPPVCRNVNLQFYTGLVN
jgi:type IV pilus assembly protein PilA